MSRNIASNALTLLIVILVGLGELIAWGQRQYVAPGPLTRAICLKVARGVTMARLAQDLAREKAVENTLVMRIGADYLQKSAELKAGSYLVPARASMRDIVDIVTYAGKSTCGTEVVMRIGVLKTEIQLLRLDPVSKRFVLKVSFAPTGADARPGYAKVLNDTDTRYRIALAEGVTSWEVVKALKEASFLSGQVKKTPAEGTLAPDSYEVTKGEDRGILLAKMAARQSKILASAWMMRASGLPFKTPEEALILASIVEKETGKANERGLVASVFINRLKRHMRLQTDPAVIYGITKGKRTLGHGLRQSELARTTPYNTYKRTGLPPTPIANPGRASIEAVLNPATSDYLFFVADGSGGHAFAATNAEHRKNVAKWRKINALRKASGN